MSKALEVLHTFFGLSRLIGTFPLSLEDYRLKLRPLVCSLSITATITIIMVSGALHAHSLERQMSNTFRIILHLHRIGSIGVCGISSVWIIIRKDRFIAIADDIVRIENMLLAERIQWQCSTRVYTVTSLILVSVTIISLPVAYYIDLKLFICCIIAVVDTTIAYSLISQYCGIATLSSAFLR